MKTINWRREQPIDPDISLPSMVCFTKLTKKIACPLYREANQYGESGYIIVNLQIDDDSYERAKFPFQSLDMDLSTLNEAMERNQQFFGIKLTDGDKVDDWKENRIHNPVKKVDYIIPKREKIRVIKVDDDGKEVVTMEIKPLKAKGTGKRGRKANPEWIGLPRKLTCTGPCGKEKATTPVQFLKCVAKAGLTQEEYIKTYVCRSCRKIIRERG